MRIANRPATPALTIDADAATSEMRRPIETVARVLSLSHYDPARDHQIGVQQAQRPDGAGWREDTIELAAALDATRAKAIAHDTLLRRERGRVTRRVVLDAEAIGIVPGAAVTLPGGDAAWRVTRASVEGMQVTLDLAPTAAAGEATAADPGRVLAAPDAVVGVTLIQAAELPGLDDRLASAPQVAVFAAGAAPGWRRAAILHSRDEGATWEPAGSTAAPATMGTLAQPLPRTPAVLVDRRDAIEVTLAHDAMTLESVDEATLDRGANLALVGDELIQFRVATPTGPTRWRLSGLSRGARGTDPAAHPAGARFILVERETMLLLNAGTWRIGDKVRVMASGVGDVTTPVEATVTLTGTSIAPPAPVHLRAEAGADGALTIAWVRRSRLGWRWDDGVDAPLAEEREAYRVTIGDDRGTRDVVTDAPRLTVAAADRGRGAATIAVRQLGTHAPSPPAIITVEGLTI